MEPGGGQRVTGSTTTPSTGPAGPGAGPQPQGDPPRPVALWLRVERSTVGQAAITFLVFVLVFVLFFWNVPDSGLREAGLDVARPLGNITGLDQNWRVFAPNPRRVALDLYATIEYADGEVVRWSVPDESEPFLSPYRTYRWRKWMEHVRLDDKQGLWRPAAEWLARKYTVDDREPVRVSLTRRWYDLPAPGSGAPTPEYNEFTYFELDVP